MASDLRIGTLPRVLYSPTAECRRCCRVIFHVRGSSHTCDICGGLLVCGNEHCPISEKEGIAYEAIASVDTESLPSGSSDQRSPFVVEPETIRESAIEQTVGTDRGKKAQPEDCQRARAMNKKQFEASVQIVDRLSRLRAVSASLRRFYGMLSPLARKQRGARRQRRRLAYHRACPRSRSRRVNGRLRKKGRRQ